jgi:hypothetical protein
VLAPNYLLMTLIRVSETRDVTGGAAVASICVTGMERSLKIGVLQSIPIVLCTMQSEEWVPPSVGNSLTSHVINH